MQHLEETSQPEKWHSSRAAAAYLVQNCTIRSEHFG